MAQIDAPPAWARGLFERIVRAASPNERTHVLLEMAPRCRSASDWPAAAIGQILEASRTTMRARDLTGDLEAALEAASAPAAREVVLAWFESNFPRSDAVRIARQKGQTS